MDNLKPPLEDLDQKRLEARIRDLSRRFFAGRKVDDLETWHLVQVVEHCSRAISDVYRTVDLEQILRGSVRRPQDLQDLLAPESKSASGPLHRVTRVPDEVRGIGDRCLYDVGMAGVKDYQGLSLEKLGVRSYRMAADILAILANERELREIFQQNRVRSLPIEEEVAFLRQCATRFNLYARLLASLREETLVPSTSTMIPAALPGEPDEPEEESENPETTSSAKSSARLSQPDESRDTVLSRYERILLFAGTDIESLRRELNHLVVDQPAAVEALCDDLLLNGTGTQVKGAPQCYFLVGPTGVGKNHLMESLARVLGRLWGLEIPFLIIEGPQYTHPSDVHDLRGATRGFIRSDEPGILAEFHERSSQSPLSILLVDEVEKADPQLQRFFLPIMDRGFFHDNRGRRLGFEGSLIAFTSNLGYSTSDLTMDPIGYRGGTEERLRRRGTEAERHMRKNLAPEFLARLRTIRFAGLSRESMAAILELETARVFQRFRELHDLEIVLTPSAREALLSEGFSPAHGARRLSAVIRQHCNVEVSRRIKRDDLSGSGERHDTIQYVRELRKGERAFERSAVEATVREIARAVLPYRRLQIDHDGEAFRYEGLAE
ncbi:MAG TPA: AAA family ATPase [Candidatus Polarisedimenticolia bacterium]|nr:AAA family ATPase [Candidatus Polarisedimenticolia bacterium]